MEYEDIWKKLKLMNKDERKELANMMSEKGLKVSCILPYSYPDAKVIHHILFYAPDSGNEIDDVDGKYFFTLKEIIENR